MFYNYYICNDCNYTSCVSKMLLDLKRQSLEQGRSCVTLLYKIQQIVVWVEHHQMSPTRKLSYLIQYPSSYSYFPEVVEWSLKVSLSINIFTEQLHPLNTSSKSVLILSFLLFQNCSFSLVIL